MVNFLLKYKIAIIGIVALALLITGGTLYYKKTNAVVPTEVTETVNYGNIKSVVSATGTLQAVDSVAVGSRVTGLIKEVRVKENDKVKNGQVLVVLDDTVIRAQVEQTRAQLENYAAVYERSQKLYAIGGESAQQLDSDRMNYQVAQANYNNYAAQLSYYVITAPTDGVVVGKPASAGSTVVQGLNAAQTILTIADMSKMEIKVLVDESDIGKVREGQTVSFTVDAFLDKTFTGKVTSISREATNSSNVIYYPVYVLVDSTQDLLYPTMTARVTINVAERKNVLVVPLSAIKEKNGQSIVEIKVGGKTQDRSIKTGLSDDEYVEVISGLNKGDEIIVPGSKKTNTGNTSNTSKNQGPPPMI